MIRDFQRLKSLAQNFGTFQDVMIIENLEKELFSIQFMTAYNLYKFEVGHGNIEVECFFNER